jgi:predicted DNA-binding transcriptional regulator AlpA
LFRDVHIFTKGLNEMQLTIPTIDEIRAAVRDEITAALTSYQTQPPTGADDIGKGAGFASRITGKAVPTIYDLVHKRLIPHSKRGKDLYFSRAELLQWLKDGKRKMQSELTLEAKSFSPDNPRQSKKTVAAR